MQPKSRHGADQNRLFNEPSRKKSSLNQSDRAPEVQTGEHGRYQIKSGRLQGTYVARAFPKPPTRARGLIAEATGNTEEAAVAALREVIDAQQSAKAAERRFDESLGQHVPSVEEFSEALHQVSLTRPQRAMLHNLSLAGAEGVSDTKLAYSSGYKSPLSANRSLERAALLIADFLSVDTIASKELPTSAAASLLGYRAEHSNDEEEGNWILHEELRSAVRANM